MTELERQTINSITGSTAHITDRHKCLAALAYAENRGIGKREAMEIILDKRFTWLTWLTVTQRQWQAHTRRPSRARFNDSIELREKYVRC